jgi:hypothetical protein
MYLRWVLWVQHLLPELLQPPSFLVHMGSLPQTMQQQQQLPQLLGSPLILVHMEQLRGTMRLPLAQLLGFPLSLLHTEHLLGHMQQRRTVFLLGPHLTLLCMQPLLRAM